jgi:phenylalanyl-tRNA synthetase alpha chain
MDDLDTLREDWLKRIGAAPDLEAVEALRVDSLGRSGAVTALMKTLGAIRPISGARGASR